MLFHSVHSNASRFMNSEELQEVAASEQEVKTEFKIQLPQVPCKFPDMRGKKQQSSPSQSLIKTRAQL